MGGEMPFWTDFIDLESIPARTFPVMGEACNSGEGQSRTKRRNSPSTRVEKGDYNQSALMGLPHTFSICEARWRPTQIVIGSFNFRVMHARHRKAEICWGPSSCIKIY